MPFARKPDEQNQRGRKREALRERKNQQGQKARGINRKAMDHVKLYGMWVSPYSRRVEWALKLKGIPYEYVEEDLRNKSQDLLRYNPVHKKVPVLVHDGKPITESLVILEYIDETWTDSPLQPKDPYQRSRARFWASFLDQPFSRDLIRSAGEEQEAVKNEHIERLRVLEKGLEEDFSGGTPYFHGEQPGFLDVVVGSLCCDHEALEEAIGINLFDPHRNPLLFRWLTVMKDHPVVKETAPDYDRLVAFFRRLREMAVNSSKE
ncbi:glutathione S-transferase U9-like [Aristolochia californica]|uniref:glutathione S-transferase U9-like n=1 Tax=Aristolochia californica TaxID=171875 RepID=UPI0035DACF9E